MFSIWCRQLHKGGDALSKHGIKKATRAIGYHYLSSATALVESNTVHSCMSISWLYFHNLGDGTKKTLNKYKFIKDGFSYVDNDKYKEWDYYHDCSMMISTASLFDVFLSDVNRMLFHSFPGKISKDVQVSANEIGRAHV